MNTDKLTTILGIILGALQAGNIDFAKLATGNKDEAGKAVAALVTVALGYFTNKHPAPPADPPDAGNKQVLAGRATLLLCGLLACGVGCSSLRDKWDGLSPATQNAAKQAAKLALSFGLSELGQSVKEVRPWQGKLQGIIETTFARADAPEAIGEKLTASVKASVPADVQPLVLAKFKDALVNPKITASGAGGSEFNSKLASKL